MHTSCVSQVLGVGMGERIGMGEAGVDKMEHVFAKVF